MTKLDSEQICRYSLELNTYISTKDFIENLTEIDKNFNNSSIMFTQDNNNNIIVSVKDVIKKENVLISSLQKTKSKGILTESDARLHFQYGNPFFDMVMQRLLSELSNPAIKILFYLIKADYFHQAGINTKVTEYYAKRDMFLSYFLKLVYSLQLSDVEIGFEKSFTPGPDNTLYVRSPWLKQVWWRTALPNPHSTFKFKKTKENWKETNLSKLFTALYKLIPTIFYLEFDENPNG